MEFRDSMMLFDSFRSGFWRLGFGFCLAPVLRGSKSVQLPRKLQALGVEALEQRRI